MQLNNFSSSHVEVFHGMLNSVCDFFYDDFKQEHLGSELSSLHKFYHAAIDKVPSVDSIKATLLTLSTSHQKLLNTACHLFQLLMILPAIINSTSERLFSTLHRIKSYMRNTMTQVREG